MGASPLLVLALCTARDLQTTAGHRACALAPRHLHINAHEIRRKWVITVSNSSEKCTESYRISGVPRPSHCRAPSIFPTSPSKKILIETIFFPFWPPHKPPPGHRTCLEIEQIFNSTPAGFPPPAQNVLIILTACAGSVRWDFATSRLRDVKTGQDKPLGVERWFVEPQDSRVP